MQIGTIEQTKNIAVFGAAYASYPRYLVGSLEVGLVSAMHLHYRSTRMDTRTPEKRSEIMSLVRPKDTTPELAVRRIAHKLGYRFRLHGKLLPGRPDLVFAGRKKVVFVHGCFWHAHEGCPKARPPKSRPDYWIPKLSANKERDIRTLSELQALGWKSLVVWQCELKAGEKLARKIDRFLAGGLQRGVGKRTT